MWKNRFRVLLKRMECTIKNAIVIIGATQVLHNICMRHRDPYNVYAPDADVRNLMKKYKQDMCPNCRRAYKYTCAHANSRRQAAHAAMPSAATAAQRRDLLARKLWDERMFRHSPSQIAEILRNAGVQDDSAA